MDADEQLVIEHLPLVERCARRFRGWGEPHEDLVQAGAIGLVHAARRFDASRGVPFPAYAVPTVVGAMRRHLRDHGSNLRLPRRVHDLRARALTAAALLAQELGRPATPPEVAARLQEPVGDVEDALALTAVTAPLEDRPDAPTAEGFEQQVELRTALLPHLELLSETERAVLALRFLHELSQDRVAAELGISQAQVSRLQARALARLRRRLARYAW